MASPVILTDGASLDAIVAFQGFAKGLNGIELLDRLFAKEGRIHCASWLFYEQDRIAGRAEFVKLQRVGAALNGTNFQPTRGSKKDFRVDNKRGVAANKLTTYSTIATPSIWAFATGDPSAFAELFSDVTSIGIKRPYGFGRIQRIEISATRGGPSFGQLMADGQPARAIPLDQWRGEAKRGAYALGFPRWAREYETCAIPSERFLDPAIFGTLEPAHEWDVR